MFNVNRIYLCVLSEVSQQTLKLYICSVYILEIYIPVILKHPVIVQVIILRLVCHIDFMDFHYYYICKFSGMYVSWQGAYQH